LFLDIIWITQEHKSKLDEMEKLHELDLLSFQKQFDVQMNNIERQRQQIGGELKQKHEKEVLQFQKEHQTDLENKIGSIQSELDKLVSLSRKYWDKHAEAHNVEIRLGSKKSKHSNIES